MFLPASQVRARTTGAHRSEPFRLFRAPSVCFVCVCSTPTWPYIGPGLGLAIMRVAQMCADVRTSTHRSVDQGETKG